MLNALPKKIDLRQLGEEFFVLKPIIALANAFDRQLWSVAWNKFSSLFLRLPQFVILVNDVFFYSLWGTSKFQKL